MNLDYGFAKITDSKTGLTYELRPTFSNISKIGTSKQVVDHFRMIADRQLNFVNAFSAACKVLNCCELPTEMTGTTSFSERSNKIMCVPGRIPFFEVFILAQHCLMHGVCGIIDDDDKHSDKKGTPLKEFNAHEYINDAIEILGLSLSEAENMTMTQFIKLAKAKVNMANKRRQRNGEDVAQTEQERAHDHEEAMSFYNSIKDKVNNAHNKSKSLADHTDEDSLKVLARLQAQQQSE